MAYPLAAFFVACVQTSPISLLHTEKGRLRNAIANRVLVSQDLGKGL